MKTVKYIYIMLLVLSLVSCTEDSDIENPEVVGTVTSVPGEISLDNFILNVLTQEADDQGLIDLDAVPAPTEAEIIAANAQVLNDIQSGDLLLELSGNDMVSGYVISNDEGGNFFEEVIIQDRAEDPTIGIRVMIDSNPLFQYFDFGRKVFVKIDGLFLGTRNGVLALGSNDNIDKVSEVLLDTLFTRSNEVATIVPKELLVSEFSLEYENIFVRLNNMQFPKASVLGDVPMTFAAEPDDEFDGLRTLESCDEGNSVIVSTSLFATFKAQNLPAGHGAIDGVLARDFFDDFFILKMNDTSNIIFENGVEGRCDPDVLECTGASGGGSAIFDEDFESFSNFAAEGWTNINVSGGSTEWVEGSFSGNAYAQISGFNSGDNEINVWLVTPGINMDTTTGEELRFDVQTNFDNASILSVWASTDFTGDVTTANWTLLDATIPNGPSGGFGDFEAVDPVNISCLDGTIHIAFLYQGSDPNATTRYHVDNIQVTGN